jgi:hypothetical protein
MMILFVLLGSALVVMLSFTAIFYRLSPPYNGNTNYRMPGREKALLYFIIVYPLASLFIALVPDGFPNPAHTDSLRLSTYFIFCAAHVFLSAMSAVVSYRLRAQSYRFKLFFALNLLAGCVYVTGLAMVFLD